MTGPPPYDDYDYSDIVKDESGRPVGLSVSRQAVHDLADEYLLDEPMELLQRQPGESAAAYAGRLGRLQRSLALRSSAHLVAYLSLADAMHWCLQEGQRALRGLEGDSPDVLPFCGKGGDDGPAAG